MKEKHDIEKILMRYRRVPGANVKRSVLKRFNDRFGAAGSDPLPIRFWRRPVPLYLAVAAVVAAVLVVAPIQNRFFPRGAQPENRRETIRPVDSGAVFDTSDLKWNIAHNDLI